MAPEALVSREQGDPERCSPPSVSYSRLFRWSARILSWAPGWYIAYFLLELTVSQFGPLAAKSVETLNIALNNTGSGDDQVITGPFAWLFPENYSVVDGIIRGVWIFAILSALNIVFSAARRMSEMFLDNRLEYQLQSTMHDHALALGPRYHEKHQSGEKMAVITNYSQGAVMFAKTLFAFPLTQGVTIAISLWFMLDSLTNTQVGDTAKFILCSLLFVLPVAGYILAQTLRKAYHVVMQNDMCVKNELLQSLEKPVELQLMNAIQQRSLVFSTRLAEYFRTLIRAQFKNHMCSEFQRATSLFIQVLFVTASVYSYLWSPAQVDGGLTRLAGSIVAFIMLVPMVTGPVQDLVSFYVGIQTSWPALLPVYDLLETEPEVKEASSAQPLSPSAAAAVELKDVTFGYDTHQPPIVTNITYSFTSGRTTAIVASSGGGKSTLFRLIGRIYDPWDGSVSIAGQDIRSVTLSSLRDNVFTVSQFPLFLENTVRENFRLVKAEVTDEEIESVCRRTGLWTILSNVAPGQELEYVLPKNDGLSGGQRRWFALTRGLLRQPSVLLLDEPTTGLSADSIREVLEALRNVRREWQDTTIIVVDHAVNFILDFVDTVICLENGKLAEAGTPEVLLKQSREDSLFRRLWEDYNTHMTTM